MWKGTFFCIVWGRFAQNYAETVSFHKNSHTRKLVEIMVFYSVFSFFLITFLWISSDLIVISLFQPYIFPCEATSSKTVFVISKVQSSKFSPQYFLTHLTSTKVNSLNRTMTLRKFCQMSRIYLSFFFIVFQKFL